jgi:hypothetical protein
MPFGSPSIGGFGRKGPEGGAAWMPRVCRGHRGEAEARGSPVGFLPPSGRTRMCALGFCAKHGLHSAKVPSADPARTRNAQGTPPQAGRDGRPHFFGSFLSGEQRKELGVRGRDPAFSTKRAQRTHQSSGASKRSDAKLPLKSATPRFALKRPLAHGLKAASSDLSRTALSRSQARNPRRSALPLQHPRQAGAICSSGTLASAASTTSGPAPGRHAFSLKCRRHCLAPRTPWKRPRMCRVMFESFAPPLSCRSM